LLDRSASLPASSSAPDEDEDEDDSWSTYRVVVPAGVLLAGVLVAGVLIARRRRLSS
jgi:MYXO-CTERM domain-containing protein